LIIKVIREGSGEREKKKESNTFGTNWKNWWWKRRSGAVTEMA